MWKVSTSEIAANAIARFRSFSTSQYLYRTYYEELEVAKDCSQEEIRQAFIRRCKKIHPDHDLLDHQRNKQFQMLNEAYSTLSKPERRQQYDLFLRRAAPIASGFQFHQQKSSFYPNEEDLRKRYANDYKEYTGQPYYGIKGVKKVANHWIMFGCLIIVFFGSFIHFLAADFSANLLKEHRRRNNAELVQILETRRLAAMSHGRHHQIKRIYGEEDTPKD